MGVESAGRIVVLGAAAIVARRHWDRHPRRFLLLRVHHFIHFIHDFLADFDKFIPDGALRFGHCTDPFGS